MLQTPGHTARPSGRSPQLHKARFREEDYLQGPQENKDTENKKGDRGQLQDKQSAPGPVPRIVDKLHIHRLDPGNIFSHKVCVIRQPAPKWCPDITRRADTKATHFSTDSCCTYNRPPAWPRAQPALGASLVRPCLVRLQKPSTQKDGQLYPNTGTGRLGPRVTHTNITPDSSLRAQEWGGGGDFTETSRVSPHLSPESSPMSGQGPSLLWSDTAGQTREGKSRKTPVSGRRQPFPSLQAA